MEWEWLGAKALQMSGCRVVDVASGVSVRAETTNEEGGGREQKSAGMVSEKQSRAQGASGMCS